MKIPLHYQTTEYDCGPTSVINAVSFLFEREEIPPEVPKVVMMYCLDGYNAKGEAGKSGTSQPAMQFLAAWFNQFSKTRKFPVFCEYLSGENVSVSLDGAIAGALQQGGTVVLRLMFDCWHYVLLTGVSDGYVDMFDPYFYKKSFNNPGIIEIDDPAGQKNRRVSFDVFNAKSKKSVYALGRGESREAVIFFNSKTRKTAESTVEYFI